MGIKVRFILFGLGILLMMPAQVKASRVDQACRQLFQVKQFEPAAKCFAGILGAKAPRLQKGVWLWNAALAYRLAANQTQQISEASFYREQSANLLDKYLKGKFYRVQSQQQMAQRQYARVKALIRYTPLELKSQDPNYSIIVRGYRFEQSFQGSRKLKVRPGSYTVVVRSSQQQQKVFVVNVVPQKAVSLLLSLKASSTPTFKTEARQAKYLPSLPKPPRERSVPQQLMVNITPPPRAHGTVVASWFMIGLGVAAIAAGGAFIGLMVDSANQNNQLVRKIDNPDLRTNNESVDRLEGERAVHKENYERYLGAGVGLGVASAVLAIVGITVRAVGPRESTTPSSYSVSLSSQSLTSPSFFEVITVD